MAQNNKDDCTEFPYNSKEQAKKDQFATEIIYKCPICQRYHLENISRWA